MATYSFEGPDGKTYDFEGPDEAHNPSSVGSVLTKAALSSIPGVGGLVPSSEFLQEHPKEIGEVASLPLRGTRGLGVGTQRLIEGDTASQALERAAAATEPGYTPRPGEKLGAFIGEVGPLSLTPGGLIPGAAIAGGTAAAEKLAETGDIPKAATTGALTGSVALATGTLLKGTLGGLRTSYRGVVSLGKGVSRKIIDNVFDTAGKSSPPVKEAAEIFFSKLKSLGQTADEAIKEATTKSGTLSKAAEQSGEAGVLRAKQAAASGLETATNLPKGGVTHEEVANSAVDFVQNLQDEISGLASKADDHLTPDSKIDLHKLLQTINSEENKILSNRLSVGTAQQQALAMLQRWRSAISNAVPDNPTSLFGAQPREVSEQFLKRAIKTIDDDASWAGVAGTPIEKTLRQVRHGFDSTLKASNEAYRKAIEPVGEKINALNNFIKVFKLQRGPNKTVLPTDQTIAALKSAVKGGKSVSEPAAEKAGFSGIRNLRGAITRDTLREAEIKSAEKIGQEGINLAEKTKQNYTQEAENLGSALLKSAEGLRPKDVKLVDLRIAAEGAAKAGPGSPQAEQLVNLINTVLPGQGDTLAKNLIESASQEIYTRGRGKGLPAIAGETIESFSPPRAKSIDTLLSALLKNVPSSATKLTKPLATQGRKYE